MTKQFTSMAIMILHERGTIELDAPVSTYVDAAPEAWDNIRVHHLLTHTSGIPNFTSLEGYVANMPLSQSTDVMLRRFINQPLDFPPGKGFRYSNSGYFLLGMIIESLSRKTYEAFLQKEIFEPLQMHDSGYDHARQVIPHRADGYDLFDGATYRASYIDMSQPFSAGALYSTVDDLLKWDRALAEEKLISKAGYTAMWTPFRGDYAYGWSVGKSQQSSIVCHGGGINGFSSFILRLPESELCVVVLSNHSATDTGDITLRLANALLGEPIGLPRITSIVDPLE